MKILLQRFLDWAFTQLIGPIVIKHPRKKVSLPEPPTSKQIPINNGGITDYYATPKGNVTLNDLIEFKKMPFWLGNIFKACYRYGEKDTASKLYEANKMRYYAARGTRIILKELKVNKCKD